MEEKNQYDQEISTDTIDDNIEKKFEGEPTEDMPERPKDTASRWEPVPPPVNPVSDPETEGPQRTESVSSPPFVQQEGQAQPFQRDQEHSQSGVPPHAQQAAPHQGGGNPFPFHQPAQNGQPYAHPAQPNQPVPPYQGQGFVPPQGQPSQPGFQQSQNQGSPLPPRYQGGPQPYAHPYYGSPQGAPSQQPGFGSGSPYPPNGRPVGGQPFGVPTPAPVPPYQPQAAYAAPKPPEPPEAAEHRTVLKKVSSNIGLSLSVVTIISFVLVFLIEGILVAAMLMSHVGSSSYSISTLSDSTVLWAVQLVVMIVADLAGVLLFWKLSKLSVKSFFAKPVNGVENTVKGTVVFYAVMVVGLVLVNIILQLFYALFSFYPSTPDFTVSAAEPLALLFYLLATCVAAPVLEEILFRGFVLRSLQKFGNVFAILISGVLFGLFHGNLQQMIPTVLGGIILGYIAVKSNSIIPCMIAHFFNNALSSASMLLSQYYPEETVNLVMLLVWAVMVILAIVVVLTSLKSIRIKDGYRGLSFGKRLGALISAPGMIVLLVLIVMLFGLTFVS